MQRCNYVFAIGKRKGEVYGKRTWSSSGMCSEHLRRGAKQGKHAVQEQDPDPMPPVVQKQLKEKEKEPDQEEPSFFDMLLGSDQPSSSSNDVNIDNVDDDDDVQSILDMANSNQVGGNPTQVPPASKKKSADKAPEQKKGSISNQFLVSKGYGLIVSYIEAQAIKSNINVSGLTEAVSTSQEIQQSLEEISIELLGQDDILGQSNPYLRLAVWTTVAGLSVFQLNEKLEKLQKSNQTISQSQSQPSVSSTQSPQTQTQKSAYQSLVHQYSDI